MDQTPPEPSLTIMAQYIKDFSFENPNSPSVYHALSQDATDIKVDVGVNLAVVDQRLFEVVLAVRVEATIGDKTAFLVELDYGAIVRIGQSVPERSLEPFLFSETPRFLYPFARAILARATGDAAFPPLYLNPIDFEAFYRAHQVGALAAIMGNPGTAAATETPAAETPAESAAPDPS